MSSEEKRMRDDFESAVRIVESCSAFAKLIPEVRSNISYAKAGAKAPRDVLAVDGRITVVNGTPKAAGRPRWGASSHTARLLVELQRRDPSVRCLMNFANDEKLSSWLSEYCEKSGWVLAPIDRTLEPKDASEPEGGSAPWKASEAFRVSGGRTPKVMYEMAAPGKEPLSYIVGPGPVEVAKEMCELAESYLGLPLNRKRIGRKAELSEMPSMGKVSGEIFDSIILPNLGAPSKEIVVPPQHGVDCGVVRMGDRYLVFESDPVYIAKELGMKQAAWFAIHILASDVAVMGAKPTYLCIDLNLPLEMTVPEFKEMWKSMSSECRKLGISIVAGHTAKYPGCSFPMVGGATMIGIANRYITPGMAKPGDSIIITKGAAIEASGLLATFFYEKVKGRIGEKMADRARALTWKMSVVEDALTAFGVGGVNAMHDATECGVYGALFEIAKASGVGMTVDKERIPVLPEAKSICELFRIDPYVSISEGTLVISAKKESVSGILKALRRKNIVCADIGKVTKGRDVVLVENGRRRKLSHPRVDPFWAACSGKALED